MVRIFFGFKPGHFRWGSKTHLPPGRFLAAAPAQRIDPWRSRTSHRRM